MPKAISKTVYMISHMDCPSEESLVRMSLQSYGQIVDLKFDLNHRIVEIYHEGNPVLFEKPLADLNLGASLIESSEVDSSFEFNEASKNQVEFKVLFALLVINGTMFVAEFIFGILAESTGLLADSIDMLADAGVYGISLYAVGASIGRQKFAARISGFLQMALAVGIFIEVARKFYFGSEPVSQTIILTSLLALAANVVCLLLISKHRDGGVHMKASWIFSTNDVIANVGVIVAGVLVSLFQSSVPDLIVGAIISAVVFFGAIRILRLSKSENI